MRFIECYRTSDGILHESFLEAKSHADKRYGDQLTKMAHELVKIGKYSDMLDKLDSYKGSMKLLLDLADDLVINDEDL